MDSTTTTGVFEGFSEAVRAQAEALCGRDGVFDARRAGRALRACCEGGDRPAYPGEVLLAGDGARALTVLRARGEALLLAGDVRGATEAFRRLGDGVLESYAAVAGKDGDGVLRALVVDAARGLTAALAKAKDADERQDVLTALWSVVQGDLACSDVGAAEEVPEAILRYADEAERAMVVGWIFERAAREGFAANDPLAWATMPFGGLLFELLREGLDLDEVLRGLRSLGRWSELVDAMLLHGRRDEAVAAAWECPTTALPAVAGLLARWGVTADLDAAVRARLEGDPSEALFTWWCNRCRARGDVMAANATTEEMMGLYPSVARWEALRAETPADERAALQARLAATLAERGGRRPEAVRVLLAMGEIDAAEACTRGEATVASAAHPVVSGVRLEVAEAAAGAKPGVAMAIWSAHTEALIATGERTRYREAAGFIRRMQALGGPESKAWVAWARETHPRRRARRAELSA